MTHGLDEFFSGAHAEPAAARLRALAPHERERLLVDLVRARVAAVLELGGPAAVPESSAFRELGFDSLGAVNLHAALTAATGLSLPVTVVFDHPNPRALGRRLLAGLLGEPVGERAAVAVTASAEPIAIVGMSCRYPGGVRTPEQLWELVAAGREAIGEFPADRGWDLANLVGEGPGTSYTDRGGFLPDAGDFDAGFFGISPREATAMDPQQRLLLEASWEAVERAGIDPASLRGSRTAVYVGAEAQEYGPQLSAAPDGWEGHLLTGTAGSIASGRIAYTLGLEGAAVTVDTACSASLVAIHEAAKALRLGEATLALAGGVAVMSGPGGFTSFSRQSGLARDGRCKAFSADADGTVWSEGVGLVVLERLSDAERNGHPVLAVVRGSAVNQDGASNGLTAPSGPSQQQVIRQALANAGLTAADVDAVEAHGTGTALGDPIEAEALLRTYGQGRTEPVWLGSLKSNIGHTQAAAGVGGVVKMVLAMRHGRLPRTLHAGNPTPHVDWTSGAVGLLAEDRAWPETGRPRRAAVSSFGFSGTNAHLVLEEAPAARTAADEAPVLPEAVPLLVSARSEAALAASLRELPDRPDLAGRSIVDLAAALAARGDRGEYRAAAVVPELAGLRSAEVVYGHGPAGETTFVFPAEGEILPAYQAFPVYARVFAEARAQVRAFLEADDPATADAELFAHQVGAFRLLASWGLVPDRVAGDGAGEIAAAHVAGALSLADAAALAVGRSRTLLDGDDPERFGWLAGLMKFADPEIPVDGDLADPAYWVRRLKERTESPGALQVGAQEPMIAVAHLYAHGMSPRGTALFGERAALELELAADRQPMPWVLSGRTEEALRAQAAQLAKVEGPALDVALSLATTRTAWEHRAVVVGDDRESLLTGVAAVAAGAPSAGVVRGVAAEGRLAVVFSGQGSQRAGMGAELYAQYPVFAAALDEVCDAFELDRPLRAVLFSGDELDQTGWTQPALFAFEVALYRLVESFGVTPDFVAGHSIGEIAAAHVAGVLSLGDAVTLVSARARLMQALPSGGAMLAVNASEAVVAAKLTDPRVSIAAVNGPDSVVVAGSAEAIDALDFGEEKTRRLRVSHAFHSPLMEPMLEEFRAVAKGLDYRAAVLPVVSNVTGAGADVGSADYWVRHVREAVRFGQGVEWLEAQGVTTFLELGPDGVLTGMAQESVTAEARLVAAQRRDRPEASTLVAALGALHVAGVGLDWAALLAGGRRVDLPTYPFQRERYWLTVPAAGHARDWGVEAAGHPLLSGVVTVPGTDGVLLSGRLSLRGQPWLAGHVVGGQVLFPGTGFVELAVRAGVETGCGRVEELTLAAPLSLAEDVLVRVVVEGETDTGRAFTIFSSADGAEWVQHASGVLGTATEPGETFAWPPPGASQLDVEDLYATLAARGLEYAGAFRGLTGVWRADGDVYAEVTLPEGGADGFGVHPAVLDSVLHALEMVDGEASASGPRVPFAWTDVSVFADAATTVRARLHPLDSGVAITVADVEGRPVLTAGSLVSRELSAVAPGTPLYRVEWTPITLPDHGSAASETLRVTGEGESPSAVAHRVLARVQAALPGDGTLVVHTSGAVSAEAGEDVTDLAAAPVWGLVGSAQSEEPGRFFLVDSDTEDVPDELLARIVAAGEPQVVVRGGEVRAARLTRAEASLVPPADGSAWRVDSSERGTFDTLRIFPAPEAEAPLAAGEVRVAVRAAGVNFRDVLIALGMYPGEAVLGCEAAGVVVEVAPDVTDLAPGDRVFGVLDKSFGSLLVTDRRLLAKMPEGWDFAQAATIPLAFSTVYFGLKDLAAVRPGESILIHAGTGGVGLAAIQLARHWGLEVFATASPGKWDTLRALGLPEDHIGNSRSTEFEEKFRAATGSAGVDVVLNSLAREFIDASLRLMPRGGRFLELGKTDIREQADVTAAHPGVRYRVFDLIDAGRDRIQEMLGELVVLFEQGALTPLPVRAWDVRRTPDALRFVSQAKHIGKVVLTVPRALDPAGTVVVTGGGTLGGVLARHLAERHGVRKLLLVSRRGGAAEGAVELAAELAASGADARFAACDVTDRDALAAVLESARPLTGVVHTAGVLDDATVAALTPERIDRVFGPKVDAARHLHELTRDDDLALFALYSSVASVFGDAGQGNYAAANTYLNALAQHRRAAGQAGQALAWGFWAQRSTLTGHLTDADVARMSQAGTDPLPTEAALAAFDTALVTDEPLLVPVKLNTAALRENPALPALLKGLVRPAVRRAAASGSGLAPAERAGLPERLAGLTRGEQEGVLLDLVRTQAAAVLGHGGAESVDPSRSFLNLGFDSLTSVEFRNQLTASTGLRLPATLTFDYPSPQALADYLADEVLEAAPEPVSAAAALLADLDRLELALDAADPAAGDAEPIAARLRAVLAKWTSRRDGDAAGRPEFADDLTDAGADDLLSIIRNEFGRS